MASLILYTGKGGVGKSTISAATAAHWASQGMRTILVSSDPAHSTDDTLGITVGSDPIEVSPNFWAKNINAEAMAQRWADDMNKELESSMTKWFPGFDPSLLSETAMFPGMDEVFALEEILRLVQSCDYDLVVFDTAPTGHTLKALSAPDHIKTFLLRILRMKKKIESAKTLFLKKGESSQIEKTLTEICDRVDRVKALIQQPEFVQVNLVSIASEAGLQECARTVRYLQMMEIPVGNVIVNNLIPNLGEETWASASSNRAAALVKCEYDIQQPYISQFRSLVNQYGCHLVGVPRLPFEPRGEKLTDYARLIWNPSGIKGTPIPSILVEETDDNILLTLHIPFLKAATWKRNNLAYRMFEYNFGEETLWYQIPIPDTLVGEKPSRKGNVLTFTKPEIEEEIEEDEPTV